MRILPSALCPAPFVSLRRNQEVSAAVLLPALFRFGRAERLLFPLAHDGDAVAGDAKVDQIVLDGRGAPRTEREVVFRAAARIGMAFNGDLGARPPLQPVRVLLQRRPAIV